MLKATPIGEFQSFEDGKLDGKEPEPGSWIQLLWPDMTITTHMVCAETSDSPLRFINIRHHEFDVPVLLYALPHLARYAKVESI